MKKNYEDLGHFFKEKRENAGMTQLEVAKKLSYTSAQFISNFERGLCSLPVPAIRKLSTIYKANTDAVYKLLVSAEEARIQELFYGKKKR